MACEIPDRNARPMQDPADFKRLLSSPRHEQSRKRLQELALQIPHGYGSGQEFDDARQELVDATLRASRARTAAERAGHAYNQHLQLTREERELLQSLGLTANLFRSDAQ